MSEQLRTAQYELATYTTGTDAKAFRAAWYECAFRLRAVVSLRETIAAHAATHNMMRSVGTRVA